MITTFLQISTVEWRHAARLEVDIHDAKQFSIDLECDRKTRAAKQTNALAAGRSAPQQADEILKISDRRQGGRNRRAAGDLVEVGKFDLHGHGLGANLNGLAVTHTLASHADYLFSLRSER
ncbi:hypothetical protein GGE20_005758 [Rhizobium leguminosarum]|nr:hypothetical protein [Rhizobium leguminosarum]